MISRITIFLLLLSLGGCAYVCHDYPLAKFITPQDGWEISVRIQRHYPEGHVPGPGSWPHWPSRKDDRYRVVLTPVARDTTIWANRTVEILMPEIWWDDGKQELAWSEIKDLQKGAQKWDGSPRFHSLVYGKYRFTSEFFTFSTAAVPDTLWFRGFLQLEAHDPLPLNIPCPIDLHVRWPVVDAFES